MENLKNKKDYYIDWINSLEITDDEILVSKIEDLYNGKVLLDIINFLNNGKIKISKNLNLLENIKNILKIIYNFDFNIETNEDNFYLEILNLLSFLKNIYDNQFILFENKKYNIISNNFKNDNLNNKQYNISNEII